MKNLGLITPDITRGIGLISDEATRSLGLITPEITRLLGNAPLGEIRLSLSAPPLTTWGVVMGMSALGSGAAGYAATRSGRGALIGALGGLLGGAAGVGIVGLLNIRMQERLRSQAIFT